MARKAIGSFSFLTEEFPDGIREHEPTWVSYCFDRNEKRTLAEHRDCRYFGGMTEDADGSAVAFRCAVRDR